MPLLFTLRSTKKAASCHTPSQKAGGIRAKMKFFAGLLRIEIEGVVRHGAADGTGNTYSKFHTGKTKFCRFFRSKRKRHATTKSNTVLANFDSIKHIAKLSRLRIEDDKLEEFESQMQNIVNMVENLPDIQEELVLDESNPMILREDKAVTNKFTRQELMENAPQVKAGCLVVPKTVE